MKTRFITWAAFLLSVSAAATTVIDFTLRDQISFSHDCVRVLVTSKDLSTPGIAKYDLHIVESVYGTMSGTFQLELPATLIGAPHFEQGSEYILFLNLNNTLEKVIGHSWGAFGIGASDEVITDGQGRNVALNKIPIVPLDFAYERRSTGQGHRELRYQEFRESIRIVRQNHINSGGKQPKRPGK